MTELTKLEVGKTYVFKDELNKQSYIKCHNNNMKYHEEFYDEGFKLEEVLIGFSTGLDYGRVKGYSVIGVDEVKFFKLKEENVVTNKFDKSMLKDGMVVVTREGEKYLVLGDKLLRNRGHNELAIYSSDMLVFDSGSDFDIVEVCTFEDGHNLDIGNWKLWSIWEREEKSPTQLKIEEMESSVAELQKQINELKQM